MSEKVQKTMMRPQEIIARLKVTKRWWTSKLPIFHSAGITPIKVEPGDRTVWYYFEDIVAFMEQPK